ncbi:hypothetical protein STIAU_1669 [Stigmatella aurantiaca DW4/3-1]|uniref:Uncharacterized protein n=1 Tax=Stigmatella aurantiaca (strain DW4/3-1) TaxID=378806 RepID=Q095N3_STIAD|nr:hypothetical protein STIAU_1669 [Stigmatella aurantiaca DW4/3-1]
MDKLLRDVPCAPARGRARLECVAGDLLHQGDAPIDRNGAHELPGPCACLLVIQDALPERGQRIHHRGVGAIGGTHLDDPLHPDLGEQRGEVILPVRARRTLAVDALGHERPEGLSPCLVVGPRAPYEHHRHVERPLAIALVGVLDEAGLEGEAQQPAPRRVDVRPEVEAVALPSRLTAFRERRVGIERRHERLDGQGQAQHLAHGLLRVEVERHLAGARHGDRLLTPPAARQEERAHDPVAQLRRPLDVVERAPRAVAHSEEAHAEGGGELAQLGHVLLELGRVLERVLEGTAGELHLTARLDRDDAAIADGGDGLARILERVITDLRKLLQEAGGAGGPRILKGPERVREEPDELVLDAGFPLGALALVLAEVLDAVRDALERLLRLGSIVDGHFILRGSWPSPAPWLMSGDEVAQLFERADEAVDLGARVVDVERHPDRPVDVEGLVQWLATLIARAQGEAVAVRQDAGHIVQVDPWLPGPEGEDRRVLRCHGERVNDGVHLAQLAPAIRLQLLELCADRVEALLPEVIHGGAERDDALDAWGPCLEPRGPVAEDNAVPRELVRHAPAVAHGAQRGLGLLPGVEDPHPARPEHLVGREREEVTPELPHIEREVPNGLRRVEQGQHASLTGQRHGGLHGLDVAGDVGETREGNQLRLVRDGVLELVEIDTAAAVDADNLEPGPAVPGQVVRVVLHHGDDDFVLRGQAQRRRHQVDGVGAIVGEDDLVALRLDERGHLLARRLEGERGDLRDVVVPPGDIRSVLLIIRGDSFDDRTRLERGRRVIEINETTLVDRAREDGEVGQEGVPGAG